MTRQRLHPRPGNRRWDPPFRTHSTPWARLTGPQAVIIRDPARLTVVTPVIA
ncbi:hypothetical protein H180DRAFT_02076 [Streptomyces sp. WMMB 322]|nr:hypothetical protein H180DRAFT_02076 [Streptomyces sp. WMMB 322]